MILLKMANWRRHKLNSCPLANGRFLALRGSCRQREMEKEGSDNAEHDNG